MNYDYHKLSPLAFQLFFAIIFLPALNCECDDYGNCYEDRCVDIGPVYDDYFNFGDWYECPSTKYMVENDLYQCYDWDAKQTTERKELSIDSNFKNILER